MAQGKGDKKASKHLQGRDSMAKVQKDDAGYKIIGKTSRKVLDNQKSGTTDIRDQEDREGGATRTNRSGK